MEVLGEWRGGLARVFLFAGAREASLPFLPGFTKKGYIVMI